MNVDRRKVAVSSLQEKRSIRSSDSFRRTTMRKSNANKSINLQKIFVVACCYLSCLLLLPQDEKFYANAQQRGGARPHRQRRQQQQRPTNNNFQNRHEDYRNNVYGEKQRERARARSHRTKDVQPPIPITVLWKSYRRVFPPEPQNIISGTFKGMKLIALGAIAGVTSFVVPPIAMARKRISMEIGGGVRGAIRGFLLGLLVGVPSGGVFLSIGVLSGLKQILSGVFTTSFTLVDTLTSGLLTDTPYALYETITAPFINTNNDFNADSTIPRTKDQKSFSIFTSYYSLNEENEELLQLQKTQQAHRTHYNVDDDVATGTMGSRVVRDTTYYTLLGVTPNANFKEIKRGYYAKAKDMHPDKHLNNKKNKKDDNENDEDNFSAADAAEQFVQLHRAYETLMDPELRELYDIMGASAVEGNGEGQQGGKGGGGIESILNVGIFFEVLFGLTQTVEPYIGTFTVTSIVSQTMKLFQMFKVFQEDNSTEAVGGRTRDTTGKTKERDQMLEEMIVSLLESANMKHKKRPVQIALHIRERIQSFVGISSGVSTSHVNDRDIKESLKEENHLLMSESDFEDTCHEEARAILESAPVFGSAFLHQIGTALLQQAEVYLQQHYDTKSSLSYSYYDYISNKILHWPKYIQKSIGTKKNTMFQKVDMLQSFRHLVLQLKTVYEKHRNEQQPQDIDPNEVVKDLLPMLFDFVWIFISDDISIVLEQACTKVLHDYIDNPVVEGSTSRWKKSGKHRRELGIRRAKALQILGKTFLEYGSTPKTFCSNDGDNSWNSGDGTKTGASNCTDQRKKKNKKKRGKSSNAEELNAQDIQNRLSVAYNVAVMSQGSSRPSYEDVEGMIQNMKNTNV